MRVLMRRRVFGAWAAFAVLALAVQAVAGEWPVLDSAAARGRVALTDNGLSEAGLERRGLSQGRAGLEGRGARS